ncbi:hypothetical protein C7S17_5968 [Burkholderia thailandensis]|nr:hypothetical protein [Burkholderia thailandensis]
MNFDLAYQWLMARSNSIFQFKSEKHELIEITVRRICLHDWQKNASKSF